MKRLGILASITVATAMLLSGLQPVIYDKVSASAVSHMSKTDQTTVIVKLKPGETADLGTALNPNLMTRKGQQFAGVLNRNKVSNKKRLASNANLIAGSGELQNYYELSLPAGETADSVAAQLKSVDGVETAYAKPLPAPAPASPNLSSLQTYFKAAPTGLGINSTVTGSTTKTYPGNTGAAIKFADIEYSWNTNHEDLSKLRVAGALWANGTPADPFGDNNHGTGVAGIEVADRNGIGVDGIVPLVDFHMVNAYNSDRGYDLSNSIVLAANKMTAGDVILIEQQAWAPDGLGFAPVEVNQDVYDAIRYATGKGVNVVEPAGNGVNSTGQGYNLDSALFNGWFTTARPNSGAIMVGAASAGCNGNPVRSRVQYSDYGSRVDVMANGECVETTGIGDAYNGGVNAEYTAVFNGTSSASAIAAGVTAELSSTYKTINNKAVLTPAALKTMLKSGGQAQNNTVNPGSIGVEPNMQTALKLSDVTAPTTPTALVAYNTATHVYSLRWSGGTDNLGFATYYIYRNGSYVASTTSKSYTISGLARGTYTFKVRAKDNNGNYSAYSNNLTVNIL